MNQDNGYEVKNPTLDASGFCTNIWASTLQNLQGLDSQKLISRNQVKSGIFAMEYHREWLENSTVNCSSICLQEIT